MTIVYRYQKEALMKQSIYNKGYDPDRLERAKASHDKRYISLMGSMSHTYGNALAFMQNHIINLFPKDLFKTVHVNSKIAHRQIRSTSYEYTKKAKPMIIFRPRIGGTDDDRFLKGTPLIERQGDLYSTWGATNLQPFMNDPERDISLKFQLNRSILYVDVVLVFSTLMQQIDYVHYLQNAVRLNIPFSIHTCFESFIPQEMLKIISDIAEIPLYDKSNSTKRFLEYMNQNSIYPITYKLQGSTGTREFYRYYPVNIDTTIGDLQWDDGERSGHITSQYQVSFSVKMEFNSTGFYYIFSDKIFNQYMDLPKVSTDDTSIIPVFTDVVTLEDYKLQPGWRLYNSASARLDKCEEEICIDELLNDSIRRVVKYHVENGLPYLEFIDIKIRKQGNMMRFGTDYTIDYNTMTVKFLKPEPYFTYQFAICINVEYINDFIKNIYNLK